MNWKSWLESSVPEGEKALVRKRIETAQIAGKLKRNEPLSPDEVKKVRQNPELTTIARQVAISKIKNYLARPDLDDSERRQWTWQLKKLKEKANG